MEEISGGGWICKKLSIFVWFMFQIISTAFLLGRVEEK